MAFRRIAAPGSAAIARLISIVLRLVPSVPKESVPMVTGASWACLETWLMTPPAEPRPNRTDDGPSSTSTDWRLNGSRV